MDDDDEAAGLSFTVGDDSPNSGTSRDLDTVFEEEQVLPKTPSTIKVQIWKYVQRLPVHFTMQPLYLLCLFYA